MCSSSQSRDSYKNDLMSIHQNCSLWLLKSLTRWWSEIEWISNQIRTLVKPQMSKEKPAFNFWKLRGNQHWHTANLKAAAGAHRSYFWQTDTTGCLQAGAPALWLINISDVHIATCSEFLFHNFFPFATWCSPLVPQCFAYQTVD